MKEIRVFILDDHSMFRKGILSLFEEIPDIHIIGEAESLDSVLLNPALAESDILLLDLSLGEDSGLELIPQLRSSNPRLKILILSMHNKPVLIQKVVNIGASGYVVKQSPPEILVQAIRIIHDGHKYLDPALSDSLFLCLMDGRSDHASSDSSYNSLSRREQEIFRLLAERLSTGMIAAQLYISRKTVENHRSNLMAKLKLHSPADLIAYADDLGVI